MQSIEQTIRERAYHLWLESGSQDGNADAHWLVAQREILNVALGQLGQVTDSNKKAAKAKVVRAPRKQKRAA
jgi:hypothetical protein